MSGGRCKVGMTIGTALLIGFAADGATGQPTARPAGTNHAKAGPGARAAVARSPDQPSNTPAAQTPVSDLERPCPAGAIDRRSDLCAQWRAADAAAESAVAARRSLTVSIIEAIVGFITLVAAIGAAFYARRAANEAKRSADAGEAAVKGAQRIGEAQVRAYPSIRKIDVERSETGICVIAVLANKGQSPAFITNARYEICPRHMAPIHAEIAYAETVAAGETTERLAPCYVAAPFEETETLVVAIEVTWHDVFGVAHQLTQAFAGPEEWIDGKGDHFAPVAHVAATFGTFADRREQPDEPADRFAGPAS